MREITPDVGGGKWTERNHCEVGRLGEILRVEKQLDVAGMDLWAEYISLSL